MYIVSKAYESIHDISLNAIQAESTYILYRTLIYRVLMSKFSLLN